MNHDNDQGWLKVFGNKRPLSILLRLYALFILACDLVYFFTFLVTSIFSAALSLIKSPKLKSLSSEIALIVGSSRGIGRELAIKLAIEQGALVVCIDRKEADNKSLIDFLWSQGKQAYMYTCDVTKQDQVQRTLAKIDEEVGDITMYFHCCGVPSFRTLVSDPPPIQDILDISIVSHFHLLDEILPKMKKIEYGHIVLLTSVAGVSCIQTQMPLAVSQFAVQGLFSAILEDLRISKFQNSIHVSLVHIYPFILTKNCENDIRLRIPSYFGTIKAEQAAQEIIKGVRAGQIELSIPSECPIRL